MGIKAIPWILLPGFLVWLGGAFLVQDSYGLIFSSWWSYVFLRGEFVDGSVDQIRQDV